LCFESYFPELISEFDCDVYFNLGSEYYDKIGTGHLFSDMLAVFRAVENRRPFLRVYNSGLTNLISPWGQELERMEEMVRTSDVWRIPVYNCPKSVFAFCPSLLGILCSIYCVLRILFDLNKNRRKK
jgi:apolipoprotein N-acyltransferase